jgi:hypothetical protein
MSSPALLCLQLNLQLLVSWATQTTKQRPATFGFSAAFLPKELSVSLLFERKLAG